MKIEWVGPQRRVKGLGILNNGDMRDDVNPIIGQNLIKQGLAVEYKRKITKSKKSKKRGDQKWHTDKTAI